MKTLIILVVLVTASLAASNRLKKHSKHSIYLAGFFPDLGDSKNPERGVLTSINLALEHVNRYEALLKGNCLLVLIELMLRSPHILGDYKLHILWNNTQCNPGVGLKSFFDTVHHTPQKIFLIGATCSPVTKQIAKAARHWNLLQVRLNLIEQKIR